MHATCGFCASTGIVYGRAYDRDGRAQTPQRMHCEYCGGEGVCEDGHKLLAAPTPNVGPEHAADLKRAGSPAWG